MKLKEKLAEDYEASIAAKRFTHPVYQAYLAGFEVARDMAYRMLENEHYGIAIHIERLGEEEVDEEGN